MLHFFPHYATDVEETPFAAELRRLGVPYRVFGAAISLRYRSAFERLFSVYPRLGWLALRSAARSLLLSRPRPTAAIVNTDLEALVFGIVRGIFRLPTLIVFETLIITPRRSSWVNALRRRYFALILSLVDVAICHSTVEVARCREAFAKTRCRFAFVPFGTTVTGREGLIAADAAAGDQDRVIVTAGRSGRDYRTLAEAIRGLPCQLQIICDLPGPVAGIEPSDQITIIRDCFHAAYIAKLASALFVVVPLSVDDISAGQMVLLQASALGRAVITTRTATTTDYVTDGADALLVDIGDVAQMRAAIIRLLEDRALRDRLGAGAAARFERDHSTEAYVRKLVAAIEAPDLRPDQAAARRSPA
ncbi:MAG: glycosyltransferase family 4 protein [Rhodospirillales bacterium]|nr:glycosyltransferase family 4 protein [Rhodospirillales bacterium]